MIEQRLDDCIIIWGRVVAMSKFSVLDYIHFDNPNRDPYNIEK